MPKKKYKNLAPSGKGFGSSKKPSEAEETGYSTSKASMIEILSEGVIEGLVKADKSIFLDDTAVRNPNGKLNFTGFKYRMRKGIPNQSLIPDYSDEITSETNVGVEVKKNTPITRTIINSNLDAIRLRFGVRLVKYEDDGDVSENDIEFKVSIKQGTAVYQTRLQKKISARYTSYVEFEHQFNVRNQNGTVDQFQVRVEKLTDDSDDNNDVRDLRWSAYQEIIKTKLTYSNTALIAMEFDAEQFSSIPTRSYKIGGVRIRIPTNATVRSDRSLEYSGTWDGSFYTPLEAVNDPCWQLFDILINKRYGLGRYIDYTKIDRWSLYEASKYNNERIINALGQTEPRYQCSTVIQTKEKAYDVITALASSCNMKPYWADGTMLFWQDRPGIVRQQFTQADVENGDFTYSSTAVRSRYTVALVRWNDPNDNYQQAVEPVEDAEGIAKYGYRPTEVVAYGCVSRGQAIRFGRWALYSSRLETETVMFNARSYASYLRPGDIISIADARRAKTRNGGLIVSATISQVTLDAPTAIEAGSQITVMLPTGVLNTRNIIESGNQTVINVDVPFDAVPLPESNWIVTTPSIKPQTFRVLTVSPDASDPTKIEVTALIHRPEKYTQIEDPGDASGLAIGSGTNEIVNLPRNLNAKKQVITTGGTTRRNLICDWQFPRTTLGTRDTTIQGYFVEYKRGIRGAWKGSTFVYNTEHTFENVIPGNYYFRVSAIDSKKNSSSWVVSAVVNIN